MKEKNAKFSFFCFSLFYVFWMTTILIFIRLTSSGINANVNVVSDILWRHPPHNGSRNRSSTLSLRLVTISSSSLFSDISASFVISHKVGTYLNKYFRYGYRSPTPVRPLDNATILALNKNNMQKILNFNKGTAR